MISDNRNIAERRRRCRADVDGGSWNSQQHSRTVLSRRSVHL